MNKLGIAPLGSMRSRATHGFGGVHFGSRQASEETLLAYAPMCFDVALALTKDRVLALAISWKVLTWAWNLEDAIILGPRFKLMLLQRIRLTYNDASHRKGEPYAVRRSA